MTMAILTMAAPTSKVHDLLHARYEPLCALFAHFCRTPGGGDGGANADEAEALRTNPSPP